MIATYYKLKDETWGVKVKDGDVNPGDAVTVTLKSGSTKEEVIKNVIKRFDDAILCSLVRD